MSALRIRVLALLAALLPAAPAMGQPIAHDDGFVLVANETLDQSSYRRSVILVVPAEGSRYVGVILNRPTQRLLSDLFPDHAPSRKITDPVYFGGPMSQQAIFAVVQRGASPGPGSLRVLSDVYLALTAAGVDRIIEEAPQNARFYVGAVIWMPGELRDEIADNFWHVMDAHSELLFRKDTRGMWDELTRIARAVTARTSPTPTRALLRMSPWGA